MYEVDQSCRPVVAAREVVLAIELDQLGFEVDVHRPHDLLHPTRYPLGEHSVRNFVTKTK